MPAGARSVPCVSLASVYCMMGSPMRTTRTRLESDWQLRAVQQDGMDPTLSLPPLPAQVPGHVHLDLHRAGVIPDPFYQLHERDVAWVDDADWIYETTFSLDSVPEGDVLLAF